MSYAGKPFSEDYIPTVFDNYSTELSINEKKVVFTLWDTAGTCQSMFAAFVTHPFMLQYV
jgi:GTPase SAR1 family protein